MPVLKLSDALRLIQQRDTDLPVFLAALICGFTPLHLRTLMQARLLQLLVDRDVQVDVGLYGDLIGNLQRLQPGYQAIAVVLEWSDLDARLGVRTTGGWRIETESDIIENVNRQLERLNAGVRAAANITEVVVSLPTLPFPPCFVGQPDCGNATAFGLRRELYHFAASIADVPGIRVLEPYALDQRSGGPRFQVRSELSAGFPYELSHASLLADCLARQICPAPAKKGIITDLDNTLWRGILGEVGVDGVSWNLDQGSHEHALYQELLAALAETGVLVAVATKNDPGCVRRALERADLVLPGECLFPIEAGWGPKSDSIARILRVWNLDAESVVFVDDSPLELAEVKHRFPQIKCHQFPTDDGHAVYDLLAQLRRECGKFAVSPEDRLRATSLKSSQAYQQTAAATADQDQFLATIGAEIKMRFRDSDQRTFELVNKTNQFNLNGRRIDRAWWVGRVVDPQAFVLAVDYRDKFGPLGQVAVASGYIAEVPVVDILVLSCRAFSRRIEYEIVKFLFDRLMTEVLRFEFARTARNVPLQQFFEVCQDAVPDGVFDLSHQEFLRLCPNLFAKVETYEHSRDAA